MADYTRFSRDRSAAFFGVGIGYLLPTFFQFGVGSILVLSRNVAPNPPELILIAIVGGGLAAALALLALTVDEMDEAFANVYSAAVSTAVFVPLLGVLVADWLLAGAHYTRRHVFEGPAFRPANIGAWIAGFLVYEWLYQPSDLGFWSRWVAHLPTPSYQSAPPCRASQLPSS